MAASPSRALGWPSDLGVLRDSWRIFATISELKPKKPASESSDEALPQ